MKILIARKRSQELRIAARLPEPMVQAKGKLQSCWKQ
jgi:hypothetical protein